MSTAAALARPSAAAEDPVDALIKSIRIPPRPSLLADLQRELASPDPSPAAIGRIVTSDVGMSGALLKLANSSIFGGRHKAKSIEQAILFLGINQVASLMTGLLAREAIPTNGAALASFWEVSSRRAEAMVFLSRRLRIGEPDVAHTFGLFCDTGVPLLMDRFPTYEHTYAAASLEAERAFTALEDERHSTNHSAIGTLLARNWGLSEDVAWSILHHHDYEVLDDAATASAVRSLVALSLLAESAIRKFRGDAESLEWNKGGARAMAYLGLAVLDDGAIELVSVSSADDSSGLAQIFKNGIVNGGQSSVSGSLLRSVVLDPLRLDSSLGNDEDGGLESLFEFRDELGVNSVEETKSGERNVNDEDVLLLSLDGGFDFSDTSDVEILQEVLKVSNGVFNFEESLSDRFFKSRRLGSDGFEELRLVV